eukprot:TRINITY_DN27581_c0_g1_i1.p2 TRINITY_DN27581_c0_g1~~TRINITY_DN27581_c0_g1_i1.p2  ORF type:complete len:368 (+),score=167.14 TRINITY_DN27581_c0_g1_i1:53-1105(+)
MQAPKAAAPRAAVPWIEKYRPKTIADVVHQTEVTNVMNKVLNDETASLPHLLFYGPPGSGKTSVILAMCNELYGPKYKPSRVLELNASDDRGIKVIRQRVKAFAQSAVQTNPERVHNGVHYRVPPYKIIILDEADALLPDAQAALRRIIEQYCNVTRFCLICNYVSRIIDPLVSRCAKYRFHTITPETMSARVQHIADKEGLVLSPDSIASLDKVSQGDLRLAVQYLQGAHKAYGQDLSNVSFLEMAGWVPDDVVKTLYNTFWSNDFITVQRAVGAICEGGYSASQLVSQLVDFIETEDTAKLPDAAKANILLKCAATEKPLQDGASELLQILSLAGYCLTVVSSLPAAR